MFTLFYTINLNTLARLRDGRRDKILLRCTCHQDANANGNRQEDMGLLGPHVLNHVFRDMGPPSVHYWGDSSCMRVVTLAQLRRFQMSRIVLGATLYFWASCGGERGWSGGRTAEASQGARTGIAKSKSTRDRNENCGGCGT